MEAVSMPDPGTSNTDLFETFAAMLTTAGGDAVVVTSLGDVLDMVRSATGVGPGAPVWLSSQAVDAYPNLQGTLRCGDVSCALASDPAMVRDAPLGITAARLAIAETGSVLLNENDLAGRAVSLMTQRLIVLCRLDALAPSLDEAAPVLRELAHGGASYATFVTGPSRTADIERELAVGVQGPGVLHVVFVVEDA
jgi:L-lactate dehydrogenase complex protein LldG